MDYFMDIAIKRNVEQYINNLDEHTLFIYSPTSINKIKFENDKVEIINWHDISKKIENIDIVVKKLKKIKKVVTFGGGSTIDIGKYISHKLKNEYICIPSMLSTNSYATNKVALIENGKKTTLEAKMPDCIILDDNILKMSETENLYGLADVLSIFTASYDWKLASLDIGEKIDKKIYDMSINLLNEVMQFIKQKSFEEIINNNNKLFEYIGIAGYITNLYGTGRPESGSEHIFAKELESMIDIPHGISVSLGIILMSIAQERKLDEIINSIYKLKVLDKQYSYGINKDIIQRCTRNLKPRNGRYTIVDKYFNNDKYINVVLEKFFDKKII